jgi:hypothetical protein
MPRVTRGDLDVPVVAVGEMPAKGGSGLIVTSDHMAKWFEERGGRFAVLRSDRYVFGVTSEANEAEVMLRELCASGRPPAGELLADAVA